MQTCKVGKHFNLPLGFACSAEEAPGSHPMQSEQPPKKPPADPEGIEPVEGAEKPASDSKLVPLRTLLEGWFPFRHPAPKPEAEKANGDVGREHQPGLCVEDPAGGVDGTRVSQSRGEVLEAKGEGVGGREVHAVGGGREGDEGVAILEGLDDRVVGQHELRNCHGFLEGEEGGGNVEQPGVGGDENGADVDVRGGFTQVPAVTSVLGENGVGVQEGVAESVGLKDTELEVKEKIDLEVLAGLLRDFVREVGCESLISIRSCENGDQLSSVAGKGCVVEGMVPGLGSVRLQKGLGDSLHPSKTSPPLD